MEEENKSLEIKQTKEGSVLTCSLKGWLDPNTSPDLLLKLHLDDVSELIIDMKQVEYVFSAGLRAFLQIQRIMEAQNGSVKLVNVSDSIRSIFEYTGFEGLLEKKA